MLQQYQTIKAGDDIHAAMRRFRQNAPAGYRGDIFFRFERDEQSSAVAVEVEAVGHDTNAEPIPYIGDPWNVPVNAVLSNLRRTIEYLSATGTINPSDASSLLDDLNATSHLCDFNDNSSDALLLHTKQG